MFDMGTRNVRIVLFYTIGVMGLAMSWSAWSDPVAYPPAVQLFYFAVMCTALPAISSLSVQLSAMRDRLKSQRSELEAALTQIQLVATHDELTKLANRRHMITLLGEHITRHARHGLGFSVALADIDHFKNVNDTYGHRVGDEALVSFASQARAQLRNTDIIARWGGEEFLMLLPEGNPPGDPNVGVERLRGALAVAQASAQAPHLRIAFSTGMTRYIEGEAIDDMIERADRALYEAKSSGRNRTVTL
jgi:diguanylate cyclase (GGDEF)-like protein